ncbi:alpha-N-acetylgalactosaminide alpha-2,6-sialyltransferase 1-like [Anoplopoma fimbria]|uniref:alpha-N-acetylgalactosaminide alpha-2,6-sialyltransferase 1-like n=1 Tax=Anoplopoma fimbria TaxID=229290 RepID=UPI0023EB767A|nr:alpha-N-acetylgalactosaminide alpha-2,6-sialyltransferase 1-like [Anoplopoma fimbria]
MDMFPLLSDILENSPQVKTRASVSQHLSQLAETFDEYFPEDPRNGHMWILDPFSVDPTDNDVALPSHLESQLLEVSTDSTLKLQWGELELGSFWIAVSKEYPCLALRAVKLLLPFTTTHLCESGFSTVATTKTKARNRLRATLEATLRTPMPVLSRKSFKKLPEWDFEDIYNQDAPPRQTTCAKSLRNSQDESFKKAFLPNIRLFMHKINMSEWNRLSHFNNPFGFMEFNHDEVMAGAKLIPKPNEPLLLPKPGSDRCMSCAVVGMGGILNGSKMGKEIDAHDYVFRMNGAITKGFEEDVGNRTSVYVHTAHSITASQYLLRKYEYKSIPDDEGIKYVMIPEGMRDFNWMEGLFKNQRVTAGQYKNKRPWTYYAEQYNETRFYVLHQDFLRYVRNRFLKSPHLNDPHWAIVRPTNGAFTLFLALHTCDTVS